MREKIGLFYLSTCCASTVPLEEKEPIEVRSRRMPRVTPILRRARKALQDSDLVKALQSEITHELSSTPFQVLSFSLSLASMPFLLT